MTWTTRGLAVGSQLALALYLQAIEWIPMPPWNDLSRGNGQERLDLGLAVLSVLLVAGTIARRIWVLAVGAAVYGTWLWLQIDFWWRPFVLGATEREIAFHARWFGRTWTFLPPLAGSPGPDAAHVMLHVLIVSSFVATSIYAYRLIQSARRSPTCRR